MQNKYVGDIGDYCKLGLLRWLSGMHPETGSTKFSLGVGWYAVPDDFDPPVNRDGRHINYLGLDHDISGNIIQTPGTELLKHLDTDLWDQLRNAVGDEKNERRQISTLEAILGTKGSCEFHRVALPTTVDWRERLKLRLAWAGGMVERLKNHDLLFLDPDNGLASELVKGSAKKSAKHALLLELEKISEVARLGLIFYHHLGMHKSHSKQISDITNRLSHMTNGSWDIRSITFNRNTTRTFFILIRQSHPDSTMLHNRIETFIQKWLRPEGAISYFT